MYRTCLKFSSQSMAAKSKFDINALINRSPKDLYNKIFVNYVQKETDPKWKKKRSKQYFMKHPNQLFNVTIVNIPHINWVNNIAVATLLPIQYWLVKEKEEIVSLKKSLIGHVFELLKNQNDILNTNLSANTLAEILSNIRPTGIVLNLLDSVNQLVLSGAPNLVDNEVIFVPNHSGFPNIFIENAKSLDKCLSTTCRIIKWDYLERPIGILLPKLPMDYNKYSIFKTESSLSEDPILDFQQTISKLMKSYNIIDEPFSQSALNCVPKSGPELHISKSELNKRNDFRSNCIVSIDPVDAKDVDDALHIERTNDKRYRVGVHIADVSHFVKPDTELDNVARARANSVYLKHKAIPMLPNILSEELCSLNTNGPKLAFTVLIDLDEEGNVLKEKFVKSVIKSQMKLSYDQANLIIKSKTGESLPEDSQKILEKIVEHEQYPIVAWSLKKLHLLASIIRQRRQKSGAFIGEKKDITFTLEESIFDQSHNKDYFPGPLEFKPKIRGHSDFLIEEFMLLANQAAARLIFKNQQINSGSQVGAFLRNHPFPSKDHKFNFNKMCEKAGIDIDLSKMDTVLKAIQKLEKSDPERALCMYYTTFTNMELAQYVCAETKLKRDDKEEIYYSVHSPFYHFGLNVPLYTHFTSPIRRYSDIIVHRQIEAIITGKPNCKMDLATRLEAASICNNKRFSTRRFGDRLTSVYMADYLNKNGWRLTKASILRCSSNSFTIVLPFSGIIYFCDMSQLAPWAFDFNEVQDNPKSAATIQLKYVTDLTLFSVNMSRGFPQYVFNSPKDDFVTLIRNIEMNDFNESHEENIETHTEENSPNSNPKLFKTFDFRIFQSIYCVIFCAENETDLRIEIPYPPIYKELARDTSRIIQ